MMGSTKEEKGILKLVHPGGHTETYTQPVLASVIMRKNPRHRVTRPDVFKFPWLVVRPDSFLQPGKVFYVVPEHTIYHLLKTRANTHQLSSSSSSSSSRSRQPTPASPNRVWAGTTPKHGSHVLLQRKRRNDQSGVGCVQPSCLVPWNAAFAKTTTKVAAERQEVPKNMEKRRSEIRPTTRSNVKSKGKKEKRGSQTTYRSSSVENRGLKSCLRQPGIAPKSRNRIVTFSEPEAIGWEDSSETIHIESQTQCV